MKIAIVGASGFLGANLSFYLGGRAGLDVVGISRGEASHFRKTVQYTSLRDLEEVLASFEVDVVVNCAAVTSHEYASEHPQYAEEVNAFFAAELSQLSKKMEKIFVHVSTDAVFSGEGQGLHREEDVCEPTTVYGKTKLLGEDLVIQNNPGALVVRTNFFGWSPNGKKGVLDFFYNRLQSGEPTTGFDDYSVSSIYVGDLAQVLVSLLDFPARGVRHVGASTAMTKYLFGVEVAKTFGFDPELIRRGSVADAEDLTARGKNLGLSSEKTANLIGASLPSTIEGIRTARRDQEAIFRWFGRGY